MPSRSPRLCDRHRGIGGDGLIRAVPSATLAEGREVLASNPDADWFMDYRNGDGSISEMCGNGVRVFVHFLMSEKLVDMPVGSGLSIGTRAGVKIVTRIEDGYAVDMGPWEFIFSNRRPPATGWIRVVNTARAGQRARRLYLSMGNPAHRGGPGQRRRTGGTRSSVPIPEVQPLPPHGTNVEFVVAGRPGGQDGVGSLRMRVHERGVGETLSCGTGCLRRRRRHPALGPGRRARSGGRSRCPAARWASSSSTGADGREHVVLSGPAVLVSEGRDHRGVKAMAGFPCGIRPLMFQ